MAQAQEPVREDSPQIEGQEMILTLPWPPSVNRYWRQVNGRAILSADGRHYKQDVAALCFTAGVQPEMGPVVVDIVAFPPDRRRRDLDNLLKATLDSLTPWAWADDSQVVDLRIRWAPEAEMIRGEKPHGRLIVSVCNA
jgi:crossover junction endodeoxyribonuclease RusA